MIKSPLRYPGGKSRAAKLLFSYLPADINMIKEPFFGGGSFSFYSIQKRPTISVIANDINYDLYCFWYSLKNEPSLLINKIYKVSREYTNGKKLFNIILKRRNNRLSILQRAVDFFVLNRITFSGTVDSGGYSEGAFVGRFTDSSIERLELMDELMSNIEFTCEDYKQHINSGDHKTFLFLDPPYYSVRKSKLYGKKGDLHLGFDHERLYLSLLKSPCRWLMTYDDSEYIQYLYRDFHIVNWQLQYGMNNYKQSGSEKGNELLIANYDINVGSKYVNVDLLEKYAIEPNAKVSTYR